jgi:hypothetical protein
MDEQSIEQAIIDTLHHLPVSVQILPHRGGYAWYCLEKSGWCGDLQGAMSAGLSSLIEQIADDTGVTDDLMSKQN